jgi:PPOX class probable F420-dependent enzyme
MLDEDTLAFVERCRVARLGTADSAGQPHVVPVCFAYQDGAFWIAVDEKPKRTTALKRLRNIGENHHVSLLFDHYDDDWTRLGYVLVGGIASLVMGDDAPEALAALRARYPQYADMALEDCPLIRIEPLRVSNWGNLGTP